MSLIKITAWCCWDPDLHLRYVRLPSRSGSDQDHRTKRTRPVLSRRVIMLLLTATLTHFPSKQICLFPWLVFVFTFNSEFVSSCFQVSTEDTPTLGQQSTEILFVLDPSALLCCVLRLSTLPDLKKNVFFMSICLLSPPNVNNQRWWFPPRRFFVVQNALDPVSPDTCLLRLTALPKVWTGECAPSASTLSFLCCNQLAKASSLGLRMGTIVSAASAHFSFHTNINPPQLEDFRSFLQVWSPESHLGSGQLPAPSLHMLTSRTSFHQGGCVHGTRCSAAIPPFPRFTPKQIWTCVLPPTLVRLVQPASSSGVSSGRLRESAFSASMRGCCRLWRFGFGYIPLWSTAVPLPPTIIILSPQR